MIVCYQYKVSPNNPYDGNAFYKHWEPTDMVNGEVFGLPFCTANPICAWKIKEDVIVNFIIHENMATLIEKYGDGSSNNFTDLFIKPTTIK